MKITDNDRRLLQTLLDTLPFTPPQMVGIVNLDNAQNVNELRDFMTRLLTSWIAEHGCMPLAAFMFCERCQLSGLPLASTLPPAELREAAKVCPGAALGALFIVQMKPIDHTAQVKGLFDAAVRQACERGQAHAVATVGEAWARVQAPDEESPTGTLEGLPGTTEVAMLLVETRAASVAGLAPIVPGPPRTLGPWDFTDGSYLAGKRFTHFLARASA